MPQLIAHLDMDSYFASVEQQAQPSLRGKPIGVTGKPTERSIVTAFSREAKRFPVVTGMPVWEAERVCPGLVLVAGHPERYVETTRRFLAVLEEVTPVIEVFSIDEVFMDITQAVPRYGDATRLAREVQRRFREVLGPHITATLGIAAAGKAFAKLVAKRHKPNGIGVLRDDDLPALLRTTSVSEICGIGPRIERRLGRLGIRVLSDLAEISEATLRHEFGIYGVFLRELGHGRDPTPILPFSEIPPPKSVGHSKTLPPELREISLALVVLHDLADKVAARLRRLGYLSRTVHCGFRTGVLGPGYAKQTTLALPSNDGEAIFAACRSILDALPVQPSEVAHVFVSATNLVARDALPDSLFEADRRRARLNDALDGVQRRYGERALRRGTSLLIKPLPEHVGGFIQESWEVR
ncbi:MAG: DNA polymerase IV [Candidatus Bipolaricaulota bacterium]